MSEQADGFNPSDTLVEEAGGMHQAHDKINNNVIISNSSSNINNHSSNPFAAEDELVTWLQYPLDDTCPDIFQHWPPPFPAAPAIGGFSSSSSSSSSPFAVKFLPQPEDEAWMVTKDLDRRAAEGWISRDLDRKTDAHLKQLLQEEESWAVKESSEQRAGGGQEESPLINHRKEAAAVAASLHLVHEEEEEEEEEGRCAVGVSRQLDSRQEEEEEGRCAGGVSRQLDSRQGFTKDCRKLVQLKVSAQREGEGWAAKEAYIATNVATPSKQSLSEETVLMKKHPDSNRIHTGLSKRLPQDEEGQGLQSKATSHFRNTVQFAEESWLSHELLMEAAAHLPQSKESWMKKELGRKLTGMEGTQATSTLANPAADAALALGAGRAAGVTRPSGVETFSKVRTSMQPRQPPKPGSPLSSNFPPRRTLSEKYSLSTVGCSSSVFPTRIKNFGSYGSIFSSQAIQQQEKVKLCSLAQPHLSKPCGGFPSSGSQENQIEFHPRRGDSNNNSSEDTHLGFSTSSLLGSHDMEKLSAREQQQSSAEQAKEGSSSAAVSSGIDTIDMQKLTGISFPCQERKDEGVYSGGSQTSESLKETVSGSKRKLEDSECQSEDAEGESENSQARNSTLKRTRANEVHNLSERRRRNRINDKMNALRELIPNASKSNKAALLDEAIDYLKNLQIQLQVMSMRTGVSLSPMVLPPGLRHMQIQQLGPLHPLGMGMTGGSSGTVVAGAGPSIGVAMHDMTYGVPARPLSSLTSVSAPISSELGPLQSLPGNNSISRFQALTTPESVPIHFPHSHVQASPQSISSVNMNMYNTYLQQQQQLQQQQLQMLQQQQLKQLDHPQQQQRPQQLQALLPPPPPPQQQPHD